MSGFFQEGGEPDPNTDAGFNSLLARQAGTEISEEQYDQLESEDTSVQRALESTPSQPRDDQGRFAPAAQESEQVEEGAAPPAGEPEETSDDDPIAGLVQQYGGDALAALRAREEEFQNAQSLIGRQSSEVHEARQLREELNALRARLDAAPQQQAPPPSIPTAGSAEYDGLVEMVDSYGGQQTINWVAQNRPDLIPYAVRAWAEEDQIEANAWNARYNVYLAQEQMKREAQNAPAPVQSQLPPEVESLARERRLHSHLTQARQEDNISEERWKAIQPHLTPVLDEVPSNVREAFLAFDNPELQLEGVKSVIQFAEVRAIRAATTQAQQSATQNATEAKRRAVVASGSVRPVESRQPAGVLPTTREEITKAFHERLFATETTSVAEELAKNQRR